MNRRRRLTLTYAALVIAIGGVLSLLVQVARDMGLDAQLDGHLQDEASRVNRDGSVEPAVFSAPLMYVQIIDRNALVVARSASLGTRTLPADAALVGRAMAGETWYQTVILEGVRVRMYVAPTSQRFMDGAVEVARPMDAQAGAQFAAALSAFLAGAVVAVPLALMAAYLMTRLALSPLDDFARAVRGISSSVDLGARVPVDGSRTYPPLGRLADELNRMLGRLQRTSRQRDEALEAQRRFVADAGHELRTPLTSLRGNIELLRAGEHADDDEILADMSVEAARMTRLVSDLLLLAQADAGTHLVLEPTDIGGVVRQAFRAALPLRRGVELELDPEVPDDVWVQADPDRLKQVLLILLDNALKFTPPDGKVVLSCCAEDRAGRDGVVVRVSDNGPGVAAADRERIFDRFYRVDPARRGDGAGLGLAIARWIVGEHHGTLELEQTSTPGATFALWLPTLHADFTAQEASASG